VPISDPPSARKATAPTDGLSAPDLQEWVARYGGYTNIPWDKWDAAVAEYQAKRREVLAAELAQRRSAP